MLFVIVVICSLSRLTAVSRLQGLQCPGPTVCSVCSPTSLSSDVQICLAILAAAGRHTNCPQIGKQPLWSGPPWPCSPACRVYESYDTHFTVSHPIFIREHPQNLHYIYLCTMAVLRNYRPSSNTVLNMGKMQCERIFQLPKQTKALVLVPVAMLVGLEAELNWSLIHM